MIVPRHDGSDTASVTATSHHAEVAGVELDNVLHLAGGDIQLDGIVHLNNSVDLRFTDFTCEQKNEHLIFSVAEPEPPFFPGAGSKSLKVKLLQFPKSRN